MLDIATNRHLNAYYLFYKSTNGHLNAILFNNSSYLCTRYKEQSLPPIFFLSIVKLKIEKSGRQDIIIIGISSLIIVHYKRHIFPFFVIRFFFLRVGPLPALPFSAIQKNPMFSRDDLRSGVGIE